MRQYALEMYNKYAYVIGGCTIIPSIYFLTGRLVLAVTGYSLGYAVMLVTEKITKIQ